MKVQNRISPPHKIGFYIAVFCLMTRFLHTASAQEKLESVVLIPPQTQTPEAKRAHCRTAVDCFDAGSYLMTVIDIIEGDIPGYRKARLALHFENLTDETLIFGYQSRSSFMVDNFRDYYSCCRTDTGEDTSAIGIGIDIDDQAGSQFTVKPHSSNNASFDLWRHRPPDQEASHYHFYIMIDELDPAGKTIVKHTPVFFKNLQPSRPGGEQKR